MILIIITVTFFILYIAYNFYKEERIKDAIFMIILASSPFIAFILGYIVLMLKYS